MDIYQSLDSENVILRFFVNFERNSVKYDYTANNIPKPLNESGV